MAQPLDLFSQALGVERLEGVEDLAVKRAPAVLEQAPVGHVVGQRVLEGVFEIGKEPRLVQKFCGTKLAQAPAQCLLGYLGDSLQEPKGHIFADDRGGLEQTLVVGR